MSEMPHQARDGLTYRVDGLVDPAKRAAWVELLRDIFELDLAEFSRLGVWDAGYRAFSWMDGEIIAANVASRPLPLMVGGRRVAAGQIHSVATRPAWRGRGLFNDLMGRLLADADRRFECLLLYSGTPELYRPFGFRPLGEHRFRGRLEIGGAATRQVRIRELSLREPADLATILRLFAARRPVSDRLGLVGNADILVATALGHPGWRLAHLPDHDALVVWERADGITRLHDIVAPEIPSAGTLAAILGPGADGGAAAGIEVLFPPDLLPPELIEGDFAPVPHLPEDEDILCVRGPFAIEGTKFMLPLTAVS